MHERRLVLVLDDDKAVRDSLKFALELEGWEVHVFALAQDLLDDPDLHRAGCMVLDHDTPSMGRFEILTRLKTQSQPVPIILLTNHATAELRRRADALGVRHIVEKPLLNGTLVESIRDVLTVAS